jgi:hypothetical protein
MKTTRNLKLEVLSFGVLDSSKKKIIANERQEAIEN